MVQRDDQRQHPSQRRNYMFGTEFSGLERPRQWLGALLGAVATVGVLCLIAFVAFG